MTRARRGVAKTSYAEEDSPPAKVQMSTRTRGRRNNTVPTPPPLPSLTPPSPPPPPLDDPSPPTARRTTRRGVATKRTDGASIADPAEESQQKPSPSEEEESATKAEKENDNCPMLACDTIALVAGRRSRSRNNNNLSNNNNIINRIVADLSAKAGAAEEAAKLLNATTAITPNPRSYGRKRKNQQVTQVLQPPAEEKIHPPPNKIANVESMSAAAAAAAAAVTSTPDNTSGGNNSQQHAVSMEMELHCGDSNSDVAASVSTAAVSGENVKDSSGSGSPTPRDYKIKDRFKRTLMLDHQAEQALNCNAVSPSPETVGVAAAGGEEEQQRTAVKLVISKKKGSIFKSRALVPDQAEQAASKRHLYKHRWDAEANGSVSGEASALAATSLADAAQTQAVRTTAVDDFNDEDDSGGGVGSHSRDSSPSMTKLVRTVKAIPSSANSAFDMDGDDLAGEVTLATFKGDRPKAKDYYTVVRNVKTAHQIQEIGEYQEMDDDVEYILDALQPHNPTPTRCLSALQLATKCMTPAFRMHVRAHGVVTKFFKALSDANSDLSLGLCTTAIMYILSQEGLNMDLDHDSLELMMNLLEAEGVAATPSDHAVYERNKQKVRELCEEIKAQGKATHLNVDSITVGTLAMETLLSLTSKRAGEWFKEELRELGGLEHIIKTISDCCRTVVEANDDAHAMPASWTQQLFDNMKTVERCMRVLENVTLMNEQNQRYMLTYGSGAAVRTLCDLYAMCDRELVLYPTTDASAKDSPGVVVRELLIPLMKVLINLTHTFDTSKPLGAEQLGQHDNVIATSFHILLQVANYIPDRCVFELNILVLLLLINLTMYTNENRTTVMRTDAPDNSSDDRITAVQAIMEYFYKCEELAKLVEKNTDAILDNPDKNKKKQEEVDETVNNLLQKAGHHMEHTMKGSYAAILIGHLITDSEQNETVVRQHLRGDGFKEIVSVLEKYYTFMNLTASSEASVVAHIRSMKKLIDYYKKRDLVYEMNESGDQLPLPLNLETNATSSSSSASASVSGHSGTDGSPTSTPTSPTAAVTRTSQRTYKTYSQR